MIKTEQTNQGAPPVPPEAGEEQAVRPEPAVEAGADSPAGGAPEPAAAPAQAQDLAQQLDAARRQAEEHWDTVLRTRAELENLRKRTEREVENAHRYGLERFVSELLPVKDSLELGIVAASDADADIAKVREGSELTLKMLGGVLDKFGVEEVNPQGQPFNPEFHQAMSVQDAPDTKSGTVVTVYQKGYVLNGRLVRPAMVIVAK